VTLETFSAYLSSPNDQRRDVILEIDKSAISTINGAYPELGIQTRLLLGSVVRNRYGSFGISDIGELSISIKGLSCGYCFVTIFMLYVSVGSADGSGVTYKEYIPSFGSGTVILILLSIVVASFNSSYIAFEILLKDLLILYPSGSMRSAFTGHVISTNKLPGFSEISISGVLNLSTGEKA